MARRLKDENMFHDESLVIKEIRKYLEKLKLSTTELEQVLLDVLEEDYQEEHESKERKRLLH